MAVTIKNLSEDDRTEQKNILYYGNSGAGKSHAAATAVQVEELRPVLFISAEKKKDTLMNVKGYEDIDYATFDEWSDMNDLYEMIKEGDKDYNTIIIDSLTRVQELALDFILGQEIKNFKLDEEINSAQIQDWGKLITLTMKIVRAFNKLDATVIYTALQEEEKDDRTGRITVQPAFNGQKTANKVCADMDIVGQVIKYQKDGETKRAIKFAGDGKEILNDTTSKLGQGIKDNPTMKEIWNKLKE